MKRMTALFLAICVISFLCACTDSSAHPTVTQTPEPSPTAVPVDGSGVKAELKKSYPGVTPEYRREEDGTVVVTVRLGGSDISQYGDIIYMTLRAVEMQFPNYKSSFTWTIAGSNDVISFDGTLSDGKLLDMRGESAKVTTVHSPEDIAKVFPALTFRLKAEANGITTEEYRMYEDIMFMLESNASMTEKEVFEMAAPEYGMTADELETWIRDLMEKIY